ncbi:MAG: hypothetical protein AMJ62_07420 [Myxococcales bacterium SG8_38]|nr:MAG: hypothetical protein AMJ62_07420 [Myxococcales bacterium SG8_38]
MSRIVFAVSCVVSLFVAPFATAEEEKQQPKTEEQWLVELRNSATYKKGAELIRQRIDFAYDAGAVRGAKHWETAHAYYVDLAGANGCKKGMELADDPVKSCRKVSGPEPALRGDRYEKGRAEISALSAEALRPARAQSVLINIYDYGYVQGLEHGLRARNESMEWTQRYYASCITRANKADAEPVCSRESKAWSAAAFEKLRAQIESFGADGQ